MANVKVEKNRYTVDPLYQWDLNQVLEIYGLSLPATPEIHFTNDTMVRAIRRFATMDDAGVIRVEVPNALLQTSVKIKALVCIREGEIFKTYYEILIPVKARQKPADYTITDEDDIYSFLALENLVYDSVAEMEASNAAAYASAQQAVNIASNAQEVATAAAATANGIAATANNAQTIAEEAKTVAENAKTEAKDYTDNQMKKARPVNLLINSDFTNPVNHTGFIGGVPSVDNSYFIDKWKTQQSATKNIEINFFNYGLNIRVLTALGGISQIIPKPKTGVTFVAKVNGKIESIYSKYGVDESVKTDENVLLYVEWMEDALRVIIRNTGEDASEYIVEWVALYEGEYTADNLPEYQPLGYSVEETICGAVSMELLWENASPSSEFAAQDIPLDLSAYTHILVEFVGAISGMIVRKGFTAYCNHMNVTSTSSNKIVIEMRRRTMNFNDSAVGVSDCNATMYTTTSAKFSDMTTNNASAKPFRIYGLKGVD